VSAALLLSSGTPLPQLARAVLPTSIGILSVTHANVVLLDLSSTQPLLPAIVPLETTMMPLLTPAPAALLPALGTQAPTAVNAPLQSLILIPQPELVRLVQATYPSGTDILVLPVLHIQTSILFAHAARPVLPDSSMTLQIIIASFDARDLHQTGSYITSISHPIF